ncbi:hypothetical protein QFZ34_002202 [Phyllobacterium ifriqiyense]|uniref:Uncharacterized protein n=1 Tax=Phyllobacterium ifriqiyense TaxID=314238 RepID=A0ABU0S8F5_9HYPH|nr:hypothetical protein [Phyllobacterium ifriqiyense]MDQ0997020.1 hypothetical protein [Phyllobacterium ifriqiyense]
MTKTDNPNQSVFVEQWNQEDRDRYVLHARESYDSNRYMERASMQAHIDYAKWILASLLAVHGGAIYAISGLREKVLVPKELHLLTCAAGFSVSGVFFTLLAGGLIWLNFQASEHLYASLANPATLYRSDLYKLPSQTRAGKFMNILYYASIATTTVAWLTFAISAGFVLYAL